MDQQIVNWLFTGFGAAIGWILKIIWDAIRDLKSDLRVIEKELPDAYVRKDDFRDAVHDLRLEMREMRQDMKISFQHVDDTLGVLFKRMDSKEDRNRPSR